MYIATWIILYYYLYESRICCVDYFIRWYNLRL